MNRMRLTLADHRLTVRGRVASGWWPVVSPGDTDGDGRWEVLLDYEAVEASERSPDLMLDGWLVVRLGESSNQVVWAVVVASGAWLDRRIRVKPILRDEDGDDRPELVLITVRAVRQPGGTMRFDPPETVAGFRWSAPGGVLIAERTPEDGSVLVWTPPDGKGMEISQDQDVSEAVRELFILPDNFGKVATTTPATTPAPSPAAP